MRLWGVVVLACGCGRIGFGDIPDGGTLRVDGTLPDDGTPPSDGVVPAEACPTFASFCDGFESGNLAAWSSSWVTAATVTTQSSIVHSGHYALESVGPPSTSFYGFALHGFPLQTTGIIAEREWVYAPQPLVAWQTVLAAYSGSANNNNYLLVTGANNNLWGATEGNGSTDFGNHASTAAIPQSTWVCVELDVTLATTGSTVAVYVADQEVVTSSLLTPSPAYSALTAGLATSVAGNGATAYVDDVVMAAQHIGCQ
jgi:hypothetical protein